VFHERKNAHLASQELGVSLSVNKAKPNLRSGDIMLVAQLERAIQWIAIYI
jgi:hypothetical protein